MLVFLSLTATLSLLQAPAARAYEPIVTSTEGYVGVPLILTFSGYSSNFSYPDVQLPNSVFNFGCTLTNPFNSESGQWELTQTGSNTDTCWIRVRVRIGQYWNQVITFSRTQPQDPIVVTSVIGKVGQPLPITYTGGSGDGAVTYAITDGTGRGCAIVDNQIIEHGIGTCIVTITKAASTGYFEASSPATTVSFVAQVIAKSPNAKSGTQGSP